MSEKRRRKVAEVVIKEFTEWGENFGLILFPDWEPTVCSRCGSERVKTAIYGFPSSAMTEEEFQRHQGCVIGPDSPEWICLDCDFRW